MTERYQTERAMAKGCGWHAPLIKADFNLLFWNLPRSFDCLGLPSISRHEPSKPHDLMQVLKSFAHFLFLGVCCFQSVCELSSTVCAN